MRNFIVTGTDTEIGKTYVSCLIVKALRERGVNAAGFKPVACGDRQDARLLREAGP
ncbi:MAG: dethiobiotin synthase, partial [Akkermansia sp.]|nr:dethiobiotin synthase [Akkermansia sp.]